MKTKQIQIAINFMITNGIDDYGIKFLSKKYHIIYKYVHRKEIMFLKEFNDGCIFMNNLENHYDKRY